MAKPMRKPTKKQWAEAAAWDARVRAALVALGAVRLDDRSDEYADRSYEYAVETQAGRLLVSPYQPDIDPGRVWVHSRFEEPDRAVALVGLGPGFRLNRYSGKWNWLDADEFIVALKGILPAAGHAEASE